jgi:hypothetical protein
MSFRLCPISRPQRQRILQIHEVIVGGVHWDGVSVEIDHSGDVIFLGSPGLCVAPFEFGFHDARHVARVATNSALVIVISSVD